MIIFILLIVLTVLGGIVLWFGCESCSDFSEAVAGLGGIVALIGFLGIIISIITFISAGTNIEAKTAELESERAALVYQLNEQTYINDNNLGTVELMKQIGKFNGNILGGRARHENPWTSWYYGSQWFNVEPIEFGKEISK